jgi:hypothetical protein
LAVEVSDYMMTGSLKLRNYPGDMVRLECGRCGRSGQYRKETLIAQYGSDIALPDLRHEIAQCERRGEMHNACGVNYIGLARRDLSGAFVLGFARSKKTEN